MMDIHETFAKEAAENGYTVEFVRKALENVPAYATEIEHKLRAMYETWLKREEAEYAWFCADMKSTHNDRVGAAKARLEMAEKRMERFHGGDAALSAHIARVKRWLKEHPDKDSAREVQDVREQFEKEIGRNSLYVRSTDKAAHRLTVAQAFYEATSCLVKKYPTCQESLRFQEEMKEHAKAFAKKLAILRKEDELLAARCKVKFLSSKLEEDQKAYDEVYEKKATTTREFHKASEEVTTLSKQLEELKK